MNVIGAIAGGLLTGIGGGMINDAIAKRDAAMRAAEREADRAGRMKDAEVLNDLAEKRDIANDSRTAAREAARDAAQAERDAARDKAQAEREAARDKAQGEREDRRLATANQYAIAAEARRRATEYGEVQSTIVGDDGKTYAVMRDGSKRDLGVVQAPKAGTTGLTAGDDRLIKQLSKRFSTEDPDTGAIRVDNDAVDAELRRRGRADLTLDGGEPAPRRAPPASTGLLPGKVPTAPGSGYSAAAAPTAPPVSSPPSRSAARPKVDPAQVTAEAQAAIRRGAPRDQVIARMKEMGLSTAGL